MASAPQAMAPEEMEQPTIVVAEENSAAAEAVHCALTLAQNNEAEEAAELLRCECSQAPAELLSAAYQAIVEAHLRMDQSEAAFNLLLELQRLGRCLVPMSCQELVLRALLQTQQHARASELLRSMCATGAVPGDAVFNSVVDAAVRARAYGEAWDVLDILLSNKRHADKYFVSILTKSLESSNDKKWVRRGISLVDRFIEQQKDDVDEIVFNSLLNVLGHVGDMLKLQQTLNRMHEYNVPPSAVTYGTVVKAYGRVRDIDAVLKVWNDMRTRCLGVNPVTCGCVLDACVKCGHLDKAMAIFQEMRLQGLHKNTVLYATLIKGLAKTRDLPGAMHLYQEMRVEGVPCNLVTFNSLMDVCVRCGDLPMAAVFLQDMMAMGIQPDLITFSTLIKGYAHTGEVHKGLALAKELKSRGLRCDEIMYNSLIDGCAKASKLQEGLMVFDDMLQDRVPPSNITFSILVKLYFEAGQIAEAFQMVDDMASKYRCVPSRIVYTVLLRCCGQSGGQPLARAAAMLTELGSRRNSKLPDQGMVSAVISGCVQHLEFDLASRIVHEFAAGSGAKRGTSSLLPLDCLRTLFEALGARDEPRGQEMLEFLRRRSLPTSHIAQLQGALADGRRQAANGQMPGVTNTGATAFAGVAQQSMDTYSQWQNTNADASQSYQQQQQQYNMGYQQQYNMGYQQQYNPAYQQQLQQLQLAQMGYYGNFQQPQMLQMPQMPQMPMYHPSMPTAMQPQMPVSPMASAPSLMLPTTGFEMPAMMPPSPVAQQQAFSPLSSAFSPLPSTPTPMQEPAAAPVLTGAVVPAPPMAAKPIKKKASRYADKENKENNGPPQQASNKGMNELKQGHENLIAAPNLRQAI